ncbi:hypothetical protein FLAG1_02049 [Fusarium langsethiae]|uniref:Uncharacterized protein n=1 Tax=Fusarium langsethiae TaxID=179993 RepID=A0A0M9F3B6_FUSLA|nr:hypothetical protein FLAG1_02049 [Fusarium langsethiae]
MFGAASQSFPFSNSGNLLTTTQPLINDSLYRDHHPDVNGRGDLESKPRLLTQRPYYIQASVDAVLHLTFPELAVSRRSKDLSFAG